MSKPNNKRSMKKISKFIPESDVIANLYRELIDNYGYKPSQIKLENNISIRKMEDIKIDIAIYNENNNLLETIIEVDSSLKPFEDNTLEYFSEILAESQAKYGMVYNGFKKFCFKKVLDYHVVDIDDIPSLKKGNRKNSPDIKVKFWKILEHLRKTVPAHEYAEIITSLLYLKHYDEQPKSSKFFETLTDLPQRNKAKMFETFGDKNFISYNFLDILEKIEPKLLSVLLFEMQNFSLRNSDPEVIADQLFKILEDSQGKDFVLSKPVVNFMYLYLAYSHDPDEMKNMNLLSVYGSDRTCFDLIDFSSDHMNLTGKNLKDYCKNNITIIDNNISKISFLNILLKIKKIRPKLLSDDPHEMESQKKFDFVLAIPPLETKMPQPNQSVDLRNERVNYLIEKLMRQINLGGMMSIVVSPSFLFRVEYLDFRRFLLRNSTVHGIIQLPNGTFPNISIRPVILFLENSKPPKNHHIFMSNLDLKLRRHEIINPKTLHDVFDRFIEFKTNGKLSIQNDQSFIVSSLQLDNDWWIHDKVPMMQKLKDSKNAQFVKNGNVFGGGKLIVGKDITESYNEDSIDISQIRISDIENTGLIKSKLEKKIHVSEKKKSNLTLVEENDVLLSIKGTIGKIAIVTKHHNGSHVGSQFVIIRPSMSKDTEYYLNYLNSDIVQYQLKKLTSGRFIPYLRIKDLEKIYFPPPEGMKVTKIKKLRKEIEDNKQKLEKLESQLKELLGK